MIPMVQLFTEPWLREKAEGCGYYPCVLCNSGSFPTGGLVKLETRNSLNVSVCHFFSLFFPHSLNEEVFSWVSQVFLWVKGNDFQKSVCIFLSDCVSAQSRSCVLLFVTPWTVARQPQLSMEFSRQEYCSSVQVSSATRSCPTLCNPMDYRPPSFSVHGIPQARTLQWVAMPSSRRPCVGRQTLYHWTFLGSPHLMAESGSEVAQSCRTLLRSHWL